MRSHTSRDRIDQFKQLCRVDGEAALERWCSKLLEAQGGTPLTAEEERLRAQRRAAGQTTDLDRPPVRVVPTRRQRMVAPTVTLVRRDPPQRSQPRGGLQARVATILPKVEANWWYEVVRIPERGRHAGSYASKMRKAFPRYEWAWDNEQGAAVLFARREESDGCT